MDLGVRDHPRAAAGETDGIHYLFVDDAEFDRLIAEDQLLEWAVVHGTHRYGTPRRPVEDALAAGHPAMLEIDLQGARQVRQTMPEALFVFLKPPSWDELVRRLVGRGTETDEERERRLATAVEELASEAEFDVTIVNHEVHDAAAELVALMSITSNEQSDDELAGSVSYRRPAQPSTVRPIACLPRTSMPWV